MTEQWGVIVTAYLRMKIASEEGRGVRLSHEECWNIVNCDDAVATVIDNARLQAERSEGGGDGDR